MLEIDTTTARRTILHLQGLSTQPNRRFLGDQLYTLIEQLGFVQIDTIQWVERAHHMILFARNQTYRPKDLAPLIENEQRLFENWTHDASFIPSCFYPYWRHKFQRDEKVLSQKFANWQGAGFHDHLSNLLNRIRDNGVLMSRDLERPVKKRDMWEWHDGKAALEFLWRTGMISIRARKNFQKVYDLSERCLPESFYKQTVKEDEFIDWACRSALDRLGFGTPADIARFWDLLTIAEVKMWLENREGDVKPVIVSGADKSTKTLFARADIEEVIETTPKMPARIRVLSPFDPVIRDRKRLQWLWNFDYRIEIYVPEVKRIWGYYVFPLLENDKIIGRIDMKADRKADTLHVRKLWLEKGVKLSKGRIERLKSELTRQARFAGVSSIKWDEISN